MDNFDERRMTDNQLLDASRDLLREAHHALIIFHQRHGGSPVFEDICCRVVTSAVSVLAEYERRDMKE